MKDGGEGLLALAEEGVRRARGRGADKAEVYASTERGTRVDRFGRLAFPHESAEVGVSVRILKGTRAGFGRSPGLDARALDRAIAAALEASDEAAEFAGERDFAMPRATSGPPTRVDPRLVEGDMERIARQVGDVVAAAQDSREVDYASAQSWTHAVRFAIANSNGVAAWDQDASEGLVVELRCARGTRSATTQWTRSARGPIDGTEDLRALVANAVDEAREGLDPKPLTGPVTEVVFSPEHAATLAFYVSAAATVLRVNDARSRFHGKMGTAVASDTLTLRDVPRGPFGPRHQRVDDEGSPTRDRDIISGGILRCALHNDASARREAAAEAGNAFRPNEVRWTGGPTIRAVNPEIAPGTERFDRLIAGADRVVVLRGPILGAFTINLTTGHFSVVCPLAALAEHGSVTRALTTTTVAGDLYEVMRDVRGVGAGAVSTLAGRFPHLHVGSVTCAT